MCNHVDCQAAGLVEDHFCQTWSLLIAVELSQRKPAKTKETRKGRRIIENDDTGGEEFVFCPSGPGLNYILRFLRKILSIDTIAEGAYDEIYHRTHDTDGQQHYGVAINNTFILFMTAGSHLIFCFQEIYFSTLEQLVTAGDGQASYYPHGVTYCAMGYTFLQDFLDCLDCELLENILA
jgi:hypothetical protein